MDTVLKGRLFKVISVIFVILVIANIGLKMYNDRQLEETIELATETVGIAFGAATKYEESSNRIIVEKYVKDEKELLKVTQEALPIISVIGDYDFIELLSVRAYYGENKDNPQFYDIRFSNIKKLKWDKINTFDDFLNQLNVLQ